MDTSLLTVFGATGVLLLAFLWIILAVMLIIAPLMIWKHAKRAANAAEATRKIIHDETMRQAIHDHAILEETRLLRAVLKSATE